MELFNVKFDEVTNNALRGRDSSNEELSEVEVPVEEVEL